MYDNSYSGIQACLHTSANIQADQSHMHTTDLKYKHVLHGSPETLVIHKNSVLYTKYISMHYRTVAFIHYHINTEYDTIIMISFIYL